jgi:hypothetical protein
LELGVEWGHLFPGDALRHADGRPLVDVDRVVGRAILSWRWQ